MGGDGCHSEPILENRIFTKGRVCFGRDIAGTRWALPDNDVEMAQQVSAENQLLVLGRLMKGWRRYRGLVG